MATPVWSPSDEKNTRKLSRLAESQGLYASGKFSDAATKLTEAAGLEPANAIVHYDLALAEFRAGDRSKAVSEIDQCLRMLPDEDKHRAQIAQLRSEMTTGENPPDLPAQTKLKIDEFNKAADDAKKNSTGMIDADSETHSSANDTSGVPCEKLKELEPLNPNSPAILFNLAKCAEETGHQDEALRYLNQYLKLAPTATDSDEVHIRVANLDSINKLTDAKGAEVRAQYAAASRYIDQRKYDRATKELLQADKLAPEYPLTKWRLALLYEASGDINSAREYFISYQSVEPSDEGKKDASEHIAKLDPERAKYDSNVERAREILTPLIQKSLGLDSQGPIIAVSYAYAQQKLGDAGESLNAAAVIFPLAPAVNELLGVVYLQGNDPAAALRCFDIVASYHLPVSFYARSVNVHDKRNFTVVKVELSRDTIRFVNLATYDSKKKRIEMPANPVSTDGLGNLVVLTADQAANATTDAAWDTANVKAIETKNSAVEFIAPSEEVWLEPLNMTSLTPYQGPPARRFANNYSRLFLRYAGYDSLKLGKESLTGGEKFQIGMSFGAAGMGGYAAFAGSSSLMAVQLMASMYALNSAMAQLRRSRIDQRLLVEGNDFKIVPSQSFDLAFKEKFQ
jgi:tetratricopeptide (TPR) repeat protein